MTTWTTFPIAKTGGLCGRRVPAGETVQTIRIDGLKRTLVRCAACADTAHTSPQPERAE
jgi:hypothetical protein